MTLTSLIHSWQFWLFVIFSVIFLLAVFWPRQKTKVVGTRHIFDQPASRLDEAKIYLRLCNERIWEERPDLRQVWIDLQNCGTVLKLAAKNGFSLEDAREAARIESQWKKLDAMFKAMMLKVEDVRDEVRRARQQLPPPAGS